MEALDRMFGLFNRPRAQERPRMKVLDWYPSERSCASAYIRQGRPRMVPPLMVRKAEWRR